MESQKFYLLGESPASSRTVTFHKDASLEDLKDVIASHFAIVVPEGIQFVHDGITVAEVSDILSSEDAITITIDGHAVRDPPGPKGLPYVGNFFEVFPDHLGNHQRLFDRYGPLFKTTNMGRTVYHSNDPDIAAAAFAESDFFTKKINESHPLFGIKQPQAGVFLGDTDTPEWRVTHKFLPPALGPRAVRHYAPTMQKTIEDAYKVFDHFDEQGQSFNAYIYMLKLGSQAVAKLTLGIDLEHFSSPNAPVHEIVRLIAETLTLNKKVTSWGSWYASLPFGDPAALKSKQHRMEEIIIKAVENAERGGTSDLPLQDAALTAKNMVDYALRATDNKGEKLPLTSMAHALVVATGAGFTTTSSLLSWLLYGIVTYPGIQEKLLQELVDNDFNDDMEITSDYTDKLTYLDRFIKETQRRHNPSFQPGRTAKTDLILPGGYKLPKDSIIIPALHHIHNNPALWDNPAKFDPERWETPEVKNRHKAAYIPFAAGPRMCIGFNFALQEVKIFLPKLIWRYHFVKDGDETIEYDPMFQLIRPNNLYLKAERRGKWPPKTEKADSVIEAAVMEP
ncbi:cytochrome P450 [Karstenula rhodostoma CBS 690.94]|uniref:Cytochrome P450 n=1 Tax=Karstenula rhodostoma CBS 690.94 TaxID=1392251 RepID=A0A9P4UEI8_9PLEO|nr:cytochrome P450 [Karstenula rhodostoma CBS 690.94]